MAASSTGPTSMPLNPSRLAVPTIPGPMATIVASASHDVTGDGQRAVDRHRLVIAAERMPTRDGRVDELAFTERRNQIGERERQRGAVGHDVREPRRSERAA